MTIPASHCEAILRGMSKQANKDGDWIEVKFQIHPQEVPQALWDADLRSRWQLAFVEIGADEQPVSPRTKSARKPAATRAEKARRMCGVKEFQDWTKSGRTGNLEPDAQWELSSNDYRYVTTSRWIKEQCHVRSKSEFDTNEMAAINWDALLAEYEQSVGRMATRTGG